MRKLVLIPVAAIIAALLASSALAAQAVWKANTLYQSAHPGRGGNFVDVGTGSHASGSLKEISTNGEMEFHLQPCSPKFGWVIGQRGAGVPNPAPPIKIRPNGSFSATRLNQEPETVGGPSTLEIKVSGKFFSPKRGTITYQVVGCPKYTQSLTIAPGQ